MSGLKAYRVADQEGFGGIVFARFNAEARRRGAGIYGDGDWDSVECGRAPHFDSCAPGPVTDEALWESGWTFECDCGRMADPSGGGVLIAGQFRCEDCNPAITLARLLVAASRPSTKSREGK